MDDAACIHTFVLPNRSSTTFVCFRSNYCQKKTGKQSNQSDGAPEHASRPINPIVVLEHEWAILWTEIEHVWHCFIFDALCAENMTTCKTCSISVHKNNHEWSNTIMIFQNKRISFAFTSAKCRSTLFLPKNRNYFVYIHTTCRLKISFGKNLCTEQLSVSNLFFKFGLNLRAYLWTDRMRLTDHSNTLRGATKIL